MTVNSATGPGETDWEAFRVLLDEQMEWPGHYLFKFIVPTEELAAMESVFSGVKPLVRASSKGNYVSVTAKIEVESVDEVIVIYEAANDIPGVIAL